MLTHSREKLFVCHQCNYSCTAAENLNTHILIHAGHKRGGVIRGTAVFWFRTNPSVALNVTTLAHSLVTSKNVLSETIPYQIG